MTRAMQDLVLQVVAELNPTLPDRIEVESGQAAALYGRTGVLDSMALVTLVIALEQLIEEEYGVSVSLADERAVSQSSSPFRTIGTLASYAEARVQEAKRS